MDAAPQRAPFVVAYIARYHFTRSDRMAVTITMAFAGIAAVRQFFKAPPLERAVIFYFGKRPAAHIVNDRRYGSANDATGAKMRRGYAVERARAHSVTRALGLSSSRSG